MEKSTMTVTWFTDRILLGGQCYTN